MDKSSFNQISKESEFRKSIDSLKQEFIAAMDDDFNTSQALGKLFEILTHTNIELQNSNPQVLYAISIIEELSNILNFSPKKIVKIDQNLKDFADSKIIERNLARKNKDFKKADSIRDELLSKGITIEDTKEGTTWRKL